MAETAVRKAAQRLRKRAGSKPGKARFAKLTAEEKTAVGRHAAHARWGTGEQMWRQSPQRRHQDDREGDGRVQVEESWTRPEAWNEHTSA